jgi:thiosulfate/3-mercaptopyruvate sulfurtransferase
MTKLTTLGLSAILVGCGLLGSNDLAHLVTVEQIAAKMNENATVQLIDVRPEEEFFHGHIPGSKNLWRKDIQDMNNDVEGMRLPKKDLENLLQEIGISSYDSIYIYDAKGNVDAARLHWMLQLYGFEKVALIDGGYIQWRLKSLPIQEGMPSAYKASFKFEGEGEPALLAFKEDIAEGKFEQIIDARSLEEYNGTLTKNGAVRAGHIPGAIRFDYIDMLEGGAFTFKSKERLLEMMAQKGLSPDKNTVVYCHSGVRSAMALFVLKNIAGMEHVSNYDGSWIEWSQDETLPIAGESTDK